MSDLPDAGRPSSLRARQSVGERRVARLRVAEQALRLVSADVGDRGAVEACRTVLDALGLLPPGTTTGVP